MTESVSQILPIYTKGTVPFVYLITFFNSKFPPFSDLKLEVFLYLSTRFSKDKPSVLLKALIFRRKRFDVLLKEEKTCNCLAQKADGCGERILCNS